MEKEHAYRKMEKDIKDGRLKNVLLLYGKEQYLIKWSVNLIINKFIDANCREMDFSALDPEKTGFSAIVENCETLSLFSEKRVVYLPDFPPLSGGNAKLFSDANEKELAEYMKEVPDTCILILTAESVDKRKKLYKELVGCGGVYEFSSLDESTLRGFIEKRFKSAAKLAKPSVINAFIEASGYFHKETEYNLYNLENDAKKIIAHSEGSEIMLSDVLSVVSGDVESNIFGMIDAVSRNRKDEAYRLLFDLLYSGGNIFMILSLLAAQFEMILEIKEMKEEGKLFAQMQSVLNVHEFRIKKAASFSENYSRERLREILRRVYQVEKNIKSGLMDQNLALEMFIAEV